MAQKQTPPKMYRQTFTYQGKRYDLTASDEKKLIRKVVELQIELEKGNVIMNPNTTVARWCDEWLEVYKKPKVGARHYKNLETFLRLHIKPQIGYLKLRDVKRINLQKILNLHENESHGQVTKLRSCLYDIFNRAYVEELITKNPAASLDLPKANRGERVTFTDAEYNACLEVALKHRAGLWIMLMLTCGLRPQETVPLKWMDIDAVTRMITIDKAVTFIKNQPVAKGTKTKAGNRTVPIRDELLPLIQKANKSTPYVFANTRGGQISEMAMRRMWESFILNVDLQLGATPYRNGVKEGTSKIQPNLTPYSCRHTCITRLVLAGVDVKTMQIFAGHESAETTLKYYTHLDKFTAAQRILEFTKCGNDVGLKNEILT